MDWKIKFIPVPVTDVDRAKAFYQKVGFNAPLSIAAVVSVSLVGLNWACGAGPRTGGQLDRADGRAHQETAAPGNWF